MRLILIFLLFLFPSCWVLRAYKVRKLALNDHKKLPSVNISRSEKSFPFIYAEHAALNKNVKDAVEAATANTETAAFLVIRNDSILYEKYSLGFANNDLFPSNSMAKSFIGTLLAITLFEGKILSVEQPVTDYLPELGKKDARFREIKIRHLLDMRSGLDVNEGCYTLQDDAVKISFRRNVEKHLLKLKIKESPGNFKYQSVNTQLLGLIIERASGQKLQDYFADKIWKVIGTEHDATWNVDSKKRKHVLTSAGLNATARDFARLARLYLNKGKLSGAGVIDPAWVNTIISSDTMKKYGGYKNQWWNMQGCQYEKDSIVGYIELSPGKKIQRSLTDHGHNLGYATNAFCAYGFLDQIIYVDPDKRLVIVRIGRGWKKGEKFIHSIYRLGEKL